jgi:superfamily II DNA or RNA helicase
VDRNYFASNYPLIRLPKQHAPSESGLRRGQLGAIYALSAHFAIKHDPAIVVMPTGAGKTGSLMLCPFMEEATRVLVVTPSQLLRDQIAEEFSTLSTLRRAQAIPDSVPSPDVHQARHKLYTPDDWDDLRESS